MKPIVGIICEYDPFHRGHARQFALIRERLPGARIMCVMSGCFTQRGMPALFSPAFRAQAALQAGASLVLELPSAFAVRDAENFALGGVSLLHQLGCVTHLSFGCETENLPLLTAAANALEHPSAAFIGALRHALSAGQPFAAAQAAAVFAALEGQLASDGIAARGSVATSTDAPQLHSCSPADNVHPGPASIPSGAFGAESTQPGGTLAAFLVSPNNILGISYLRALLRLQSSIIPFPVRRESNYHADTVPPQGYPSASAVRKAYLAGNLSVAKAACGYSLSGTHAHAPEALDTALLYRLRQMDAPALAALPDCSEGLENRLARAARQATGRAALLSLLKTRRYPYARLNRLVTHALLGIDAGLLAAYPQPPYGRLLGFRKEDGDLLRLLSEGQLPIVAKAADGDRTHPLYQLDEHAYDLWALGAGLPAGLMYRQPLVIV